jgi:hypothetical protein
MSQENSKRTRSKLSAASLDGQNSTKKANDRSVTIIESSEENNENEEQYEDVFSDEEDKATEESKNR